MAPTLSNKFSATVLLALVSCLDSVTSARSIAPLLRRGSPAISSSLPSGWTSMGCYTDSPSSRTLAGSSYDDSGSSPGMSEESCIAFCSQKNYVYAGVEFGGECYCDNELASSGVPTSSSSCSSPCAGNPNELCGGAGALNLFWSGGAPVYPLVVPSVGQCVSVGCYSDNTTARTLPTLINTSSQMTVEYCVTECQANGYTYAGLEDGSQCFCANGIQNGGTPTSSGCITPCEGDDHELCGGPAYLNVYSCAGNTVVTTTTTTTTATPSTTTLTITSTDVVKTTTITGQTATTTSTVTKTSTVTTSAPKSTVTVTSDVTTTTTKSFTATTPLSTVTTTQSTTITDTITPVKVTTTVTSTQTLPASTTTVAQRTETRCTTTTITSTTTHTASCTTGKDSWPMTGKGSWPTTGKGSWPTTKAGGWGW